MSGPVTEFGYFPLKAGNDASDENSPAAKALKASMQTMLSQPGVQRAYWGVEVENPNVVRLFGDWDNVEDHINFTKSEAYGPMMATIAPLLDEGAYIKHWKPVSFPPKPVLDGSAIGVTEVINAFFPADHPADARADAVARVTQFTDVVSKHCADFKGFATGWSLEDDIPIAGDAEGKTGSVMVTLIAWPSVEAHHKFRDDPVFKENIHLVRGLPGLLKLSVFHVKCEVVEKA